MKKFIILSLIAVFAHIAQAQTPNSAIDRLFNEFGRMGITGVHYYANAYGQECYLEIFTGARYDIHDIVEMNRIMRADYPFQLEGTKEYVDKQLKECDEGLYFTSKVRPMIRHLLDSLAPLSKECYHHEIHNDVWDTVKYVIALNDIPKKTFQERVGGGFDRGTGDEFIDYLSYKRGTFLHYVFPAIQKSNNVVPYSLDSLKAVIENYLNKYDGKKYNVSYRVKNQPKDLQYYYYNPSEWNGVYFVEKGFSRSIGTHYFFPLAKKEQNDMAVEISNIFTNYLKTRDDTSLYVIAQSLPLENPVYNREDEDMYFYAGEDYGKHFSVNLMRTNEGIHVLLLTNEGNWQVPVRKWIEIKSIDCDKIVYEKDFNKRKDL